MENLKLQFKSQKLHHAYLLVGDRGVWRDFLDLELKSFFKTRNLSTEPDIFWQSYDSFGIKDAHALTEREARRGFGARGRFFVLEISNITPEAQNALLKTLEEPATDAHFFIIARSADIFLPTLLSRLQIIQITTHQNFTEGNPMGNFGLKFLGLDLPDRLDFIQKEFLKNKNIGKGEIIDFVADLEKIFRAGIDIKKITKDEELALFELEKCQRYLQNPRSSNRLILEHLAFVIPLV